MTRSWDARFTTETMRGGASARADTPLRPEELALLSRHRTQLNGEVLELGCCGDGLTDWLAYNATSFTGVGMSRAAAELCSQRFASSAFLAAPLTDLGRFDHAQFTAIVAGRESLGQLSESEGRGVFDQISRILAPGGVLIFSAGNCEPPVPEHPSSLSRLVRAVRRRRGDDTFAVFDRRPLREAQEVRLAEHDLALSECHHLGDGQEIYCVARRSTRAVAV